MSRLSLRARLTLAFALAMALSVLANSSLPRALNCSAFGFNEVIADGVRSLPR